MLKITPHYRTQADLQKAEEPYKTVATILDDLYYKGPKDKKELSYQHFKNIYVVSCIRHIAEDLNMHSVSFVNSMKTIWSSLQNPNGKYSNYYDNYSVPREEHLGTIFGGVYFVLVKQNSIDTRHQDILVNFVSDFSEAVPYFNVFKMKLISDSRPLVPTPPSTNIQTSKDITQLRKEFIQGINSNPSNINSIDWADATMGFDKGAMTEIFWGIVEDKTLKHVVRSIIDRWNELSDLKDLRCYERGAATNAISIESMKFGGYLKESINKFFDDLWGERNARNTYARFGNRNLQVAEDLSPSRERVDETAKTVLTKTSPINTDDEQKQAELPKIVCEHDELRNEVESLKNDLEAFKTRDKKGQFVPLFTAKQVAIIIKAILLEHNSLTNNVKNLSPLVQRFGGGWASSTAENALGYEVTQKECDELDKIFHDYAPKIGTIIKNYPNKFKQVKGKKQMENLKK